MYRITFTLVGLVLGLLVLARAIGLVPDRDEAGVEKRVALCEALAVECTLAGHDDPAAFVRALAGRNPEVVSVGVRAADGRLTVDVGGHETRWTEADGRATPTHMAVPLTHSGVAAGRVEVCFKPLPFAGPWQLVGGSLAPLLGFVGVAGTVVIGAFLRVVARRAEAAQSGVVPRQVRDTLNALDEGVLILSRDQRIVLANEAFAKLIGITPAALHGRPVRDLPWVPAEGGLAAFNDPTPAHRATAVAETAGRVKGELLTAVSNEMRAPISAIIGMTELVLATRLSPDQRECLGVVGEAATALLAAVDDRLDLSRLEAGTFTLAPVAFDPRAVLDDALHGLAPLAHAKGLELVCDVPSGVPEALVGDPVRVRQVVVNLVENAIAFTAAGEIVVRVRVEAETARRVRLHVAVSDTGIGVSADQLRAIIEPSTRADDGIGLAISTRLVKLMGGTIWAESQVGAGSTFHFTADFGVPVYADVSQSIPDLYLPTILPALVVDGSTANRTALGHLLAGLGLEPTAVSGAAPALDALTAAAAAGRPFPLVLADAAHPEADGFALAEYLRDQPGAAGAVVLMLSAASLPQDIERCRQLGVASLRKPVRKADLIRAVQAITAGRPVATADRPSLAEGALDSLLAVTGPTLRVLVVDGNPLSQKVSAMKLGRWGHQARVVGNGREALAVVGSERFDLVLTDVQMSDMDGIALAAAIRTAEGPGRRLPVVVVTARAMTGERDRFLAAGLDGYVTLPVPDADLQAAIRAAVPTAVGADETAARGRQDTTAFDETAVLARVGGDRDTLRGLIEVFHQDCGGLMAEIEAGLRAGDAQRVRESAQTITGLVGFFGATGVIDAARQLERAGADNDLGGGFRLFSALARELDEVSTALAPFASFGPPDEWHIGRGDRTGAGIVVPVEG